MQRNGDVCLEKSDAAAAIVAPAAIAQRVERPDRGHSCRLDRVIRTVPQAARWVDKVGLALTVSRMIGQHELVTRPLPPEVSEGAALSGAAVLSDGQIALIIDCDALVDVPVSA